MRLAIVSQQGNKVAGAEHALLEFVACLPPSVELQWFFLEDGEFAQAMRRRFASVTIVAMSDRVATAKRSGLPLAAVGDGVAIVYRLARALRHARPNAVITNSMKAHIVGALAAKIAGLQCLSYIHDVVDGPALTLLRLVSRWCASERLTCSALVAANVRLPRTTVAYAAIEVAKFAHLPDHEVARTALGLPNDGRPVVGLVGRVARWKGQDRFLRIASSVLTQTDAHFCVIGSPIFGCDDEYLDELKDYVSKRGLMSRVTFVPWQEDMQNVYAALNVACNCSVREPFGRTSLEALAAGVPIICFDDAGVCEIFEQNRGGVRVPAGNEELFASAIVRYLQTPDLLTAAAVDARLAAAKIDISRAYEVFAAAIERLTRQKLAHAGALLAVSNAAMVAQSERQTTHV